jgi:hypothetical protein
MSKERNREMSLILKNENNKESKGSRGILTRSFLKLDFNAIHIRARERGLVIPVADGVNQ